jgi:hypothetical protein
MIKNFEIFNYEDSYRAIGVCLAANIPVILWGDPGQGKTKVIEHFAEQQNRRLETVLASIREPQDFIGLPALRHEAMEYYAPAWAKRLKLEDRAGIIFFDEVNTAPPSVQAALLRVCLEKVVGELQLDDETRIIAAANPASIAADGWDLALPLANRFCHLSWMLPASIVAEGFSKSWPVFELPNLAEADFAASIAEEKIIVAGFLIANQDLATVLPTAAIDQGGSFPTPRSWEMAVRASAAVTCLNLSENIRRLLLNGCVGDVAARTYLAYRSAKDLPNPEDLIANPDLEIPTRADILYVVGSSLLHALRTNNTPERWRQVEKFILRLFKMKLPDIAISIHRHWSGLVSAGESQSPEMSRLIAPFVKISKRQ